MDIWSGGDVWRVVRPCLANSGPFWTHGGHTCGLCGRQLSDGDLSPERGCTVNAGDRDRRGGLEQLAVIHISAWLTLCVQSLTLRRERKKKHFERAR